MKRSVATAYAALVLEPRGSYGLWWRTQSPGLELQPGERVGLTIAGLEHLERYFRDDKIPRPPLVSVCLDILRTAAAKEEDLVADDDWTRPATASVDLRSDRFCRDPSPPVEIVGQVLQHEYMPLARASTNFNYDVPLGPGGLARFKDVDTAADFLRVLDSMRTVSEQVDLRLSTGVAGDAGLHRAVGGPASRLDRNSTLPQPHRLRRRSIHRAATS